ncbi:hypothetical protein [Desulfovibrio sp. SGI.169]|uniref:hypothetical protein n=1 Tax=Desulfovibrio sp. SGI.169 TaxID=3420561 RepID=UPI003D01ECB3
MYGGLAHGTLFFTFNRSGQIALFFQAKATRTGFLLSAVLLNVTHGPQKKRGILGGQHSSISLRLNGGSAPLFPALFLSRCSFLRRVLLFVREGLDVQPAKRIFNKSMIVRHGVKTGQVFIMVKKAAAMPRLSKKRRTKNYGFGVATGGCASGVAAGRCGAGVA